KRPENTLARPFELSTLRRRATRHRSEGLHITNLNLREKLILTSSRDGFRSVLLLVCLCDSFFARRCSETYFYATEKQVQVLLCSSVVNGRLFQQQLQATSDDIKKKVEKGEVCSISTNLLP